jgi:hypothetical protein
MKLPPAASESIQAATNAAYRTAERLGILDFDSPEFEHLWRLVNIGIEAGRDVGLCEAQSALAAVRPLPLPTVG